jgi:hypothetical protein
MNDPTIAMSRLEREAVRNTVNKRTAMNVVNSTLFINSFDLTAKTRHNGVI